MQFYFFAEGVHQAQMEINQRESVTGVCWYSLVQPKCICFPSLFHNRLSADDLVSRVELFTFLTVGSFSVDTELMCAIISICP